MRFGWLLCTLILLGLFGCATQPEVPAPVPVVQEMPPPPKPAVKPPQVEILVSEDIPAYMEIANELQKSLGNRASLQIFSDSALKNQGLINAMKNKEHTQIVSIGLGASVAAKKLSNLQLVFCQVFNYQDYGLLSPRHKGVSMMPSPQQVFRSWRAISPSISDVGVITGPGFEDEMQIARSAARQLQINLHHETVKSDKEYQFAFKKLGKKVQGYWLLPDNRVLSATSLRDIMNFSVYNSKQTAVFNDELLNLGGLFSISSDTRDIARLVEHRLEQAQDKDAVPGADLLYADKVRLRINKVMARNLGLNIPEQFRKLPDAN